MYPIQIKDKADCCGCTACYAACPKSCITMRFDEEGCEYPHVDADCCIECGRCVKACPILNGKQEQPFDQHAFLVQARDQDVLAQSTSGGAFTLFAERVLDKGGIVFGAGWDREDLGSYDAPMRVVHFGVESKDELYRFRNSKYTQSEVLDTFHAVKRELATGRTVLFSGTPCQCEGLLSFLGKKPENLLVVDFVCRAIPARLVLRKWFEYVRASKPDSPIKEVRFRDKRLYGYRYSAMCAFDSSDAARDVSIAPLYAQGVETDPYLRAFFSDTSYRPSCYSCHFRKRYRRTDLTMWDCFNVHDLSRELDNNKGVTRVLVHSARGVELVQAVRDAASVVELDVQEVLKGVHELTAGAEPNPKRTAFFSDAKAMDGYQLFSKWYPDSARVKAERFVRHAAERLGIYDSLKRAAKRLVKGYRHG